jgi:hypothetical protein
MTLPDITYLAAVNMEALANKGINILSVDVTLPGPLNIDSYAKGLINEFLHDKSVVREMATEVFNKVRELELELSQNSRITMREEVRQNIDKMRLMDHGLKRMGDMFDGGHLRDTWGRLAPLEDLKWKKFSR